ncbi:MAG: hydrogenase maturation protease [Chloroflexota bacterium]
MKMLIAGLGNPILSDDGVGWVVAEKVKEWLSKNDYPITIESFSLSGISLMEQMIGFDCVLLIDSLNTGQYPPGNVTTFNLDSMHDFTFGHSTSVHDLSLKNALILGREMKAELPDNDKVIIIGIEAQEIYDFGETLSPEIEAAIPEAFNTIIQLIKMIA